MTAAAPVPDRIVLVDDAPLLARQLQEMLAACGLAAEILPEQALWPAAVADASIVFIEIHLAHGHNGFQLAREVRAGTHCKVVLVSGSGRSTDLQWGLRAGAVAVLQRPLRQESLRQLLAAQGLLPDGMEA